MPLSEPLRGGLRGLSGDVRAGYEETQVWAVRTDPANGISESALEKGRHAEGYLALTIGKVRTIAGARRPG